MIAILVLAGVLGLALGSFFNVVIARVPHGESLVAPRSRCPSCQTPIASRDNVPVVSWLLLRGRCRHCGERISWRYPLVELMTAVALVTVVALEGVDASLWLPAVFVLLIIPMIFIDIDHRIIPNGLNLLGGVVGLALLLLAQRDALGEHLIAAAIGSFLFLVAALIQPAGMGMGDVKFVAVMGLFLGSALVPAIFSALVLGTVYGIPAAIKFGRKATLPFGPFLALGGLGGFIYGDAVLDWYLRSL